MKEHGIIMSAPMVLALLAGRKTVTRRTSDRWAKVSPGDRLWVRETFRLSEVDDVGSPALAAEHWGVDFAPVRYEADGAERGDPLPSVTDAEAIAEGIYHDADHPWTDEHGTTHPPASGWTWDAAAQTYSTPREAYLALFREINGDEVPDHLWRIEFRRVA